LLQGLGRAALDVGVRHKASQGFMVLDRDDQSVVFDELDGAGHFLAYF
jgi:hypothetical protein